MPDAELGFTLKAKGGAQAAADVRRTAAEIKGAVADLNDKTNSANFGASGALAATTAFRGLGSQLSSVSPLLGRLGSAAPGIGLAATFFAAASAGIAYNEVLDRLTKSFTALMGSEEAALKHIKELQAFADRTPFEFEDVARASQKFQNMGRSASEVIPLLTAVGEAVARAGGGKEQIEGVSKALSDVMARGKVSAQEMNQLANNMVDGWKPLEKELGKTRGELFKMAEQGQISADTFMRAFQNAYGSGQAMQRQMGTLTGALSTLTDAGKRFLGEVTAPLHHALRDIAVEMAKVATEGVNVERSWNAARRSFIDFALAYAQRTQNNPQRVLEFWSPTQQQQGAPERRIDLTGEQFLKDFKAKREALDGALQKELKELSPARDLLAGLQFELEHFGDKSKLAQVTEQLQKFHEQLAESGKVLSDEAWAALKKWERGILDSAAALDENIKKQKEKEEADRLAEAETKRQSGILQGITQDYKEAALRVQLYAHDSLQLEAALYRLSKGYETLSDANKKIVDADVNRIFSAKAAQKVLDENAELQKKANELLKEQAQALGVVETPLHVYYDLLKKSADVSSDLYESFGLKLPERVKDGVDKSIFQLLRLNAQILQTKQALESVGPENVPLPIPGIGGSGVGGTFGGVSAGPGEAPAAPFGTDIFENWGRVVQETLGAASSAASTFGGIIQNAFGGIADAVGNAVKSYVLFGTIGGSFKKFSAELIASLAASATIQAAYQAAQGLAWLALSIFFPNPQYVLAANTAFASAAAFGLVGAGTALAGRAVAGSAFSSGGGAGEIASPNAGSAYTDERDRTRREGRTGGASDPNQPRGVVGHLVVDHKLSDGQVKREFVKLYESNDPEVRGLLRWDLLGEAPSF